MVRLLIFLTIFLSIYTGMHFVVYRGIRPLLPSRFRLGPRWLFLLVLMVTAPVLSRLLERVELEGAARALALAGYIWMGFLFLAFAGFAVLLLAEMAARVLSRLAPAAPKIPTSGRRGAAAVLISALLVGLYGFIEAGNLQIETVRIETDRLPPGLATLRIAQVSDLHLGLVLREGSAKRVATAIRELNPDLVLATGDLVDARIDHLPELAAPFADLEPPLGKFAVTGNHEYYAGIEQACDFLRACGFTLLRGEAVSVAVGVHLVGVDDPAGGTRPDEVPLLEELKKEGYTVLIKHRPWVRDEAAGLFDLQLSGHAHRGQIFPFNLLTGLEYPMQDGLYELPRGSKLYTSRGTGTWGPPMRVLSPPELTLIEIFPLTGATSD